MNRNIWITIPCSILWVAVTASLLLILPAVVFAEVNEDLIIAAATGDLKSVEALLSNGADVNAKGQDGGTPLHAASFRGHIGVVELLIAKGAYINAKDKKGWTPLKHAFIRDRYDIMELLIAKGADIDLLHAAGIGYLGIVKTLIAKGADVNAKDEMWRTPLHATSFRGHIGVVELLIAKGADVNAKEKNGMTPLHVASSRGHIGVVELLIAKGADVNAKDDKGVTPLHLASGWGHIGVVELLIAKGADVNAKSEKGDFPLDYAITGSRRAGSQNESVIRRLKELAGKHDQANLDRIIMKAACSAAKSGLANLAIHMEAYYRDHDQYPKSLEELVEAGGRVPVKPGVRLTLSKIDSDSWKAEATHSGCDRNHDGKPDTIEWDSAAGGLW